MQIDLRALAGIEDTRGGEINSADGSVLRNFVGQKLLLFLILLRTVNPLHTIKWMLCRTYGSVLADGVVGRHPISSWDFERYVRDQQLDPRG